MGGRGGGHWQTSFFCSLFPVELTTTWIGHRVEYVVFSEMSTNTLNVSNNNNNMTGQSGPVILVILCHSY